MPNTFSASLVVDMLVDQAITQLQNRLAAISSFSTDFGTDRMAPKHTVQVPLATAGSATQTDPTNWESGDSTLTNVPVAVSQYSQSFHITNQQLQQGHKLERIIQINLRTFADKIIDVALTPVTTAIFGAATIVSADVAFGSDELRSLYGALKKSDVKNAVLDSPYFARFLPDNTFQIGPKAGLCGFQSVHENTRWTGAGANVVGFACNPQAIAVASGLPLMPAGADQEFIAMDSITIPGLEITVQYAVWFSRSSRTLWASFDIMFGAKEADTSALKIVKSA